MSHTNAHLSGHPIRLVRVIDRLNVGGPTYHVLLLTRDLATRGYDPVLVKGQIAPGEAEMTAAINQIGVGFTHLDELTKAISLRDIRVFWSLVRLFKRVRPQVVHTHKTKAGVLGRLAAVFARVPVVVHTFHGHAFHGYFSRLANYAVLVIERLLAHRTNAVVTVSDHVRCALLQYGIASPQRVHTIALGLELDRFLCVSRKNDGLRQELGFDAEAPLIGFVGRLVPIKGVAVLLHAAKRVIDHLPQARFVLVGDGESRSELEALAAQLGLCKHVVFTGFRDDIPRIYAALDLVALSSFNEGSPVALIEALTAGCYVVSTRVGGVPDVVASDALGMLVPAGDDGAMADAIIRALKDKKTVSLQDRQHIGVQYGIKRLVHDLDNLYRMLLQQKGVQRSRAQDSAKQREGICK